MDYKDTTIVIPVRIDSAERLCNLELVTDGLLKLPGLQIIVLEADADSKLTLPSDIGHIFVEDHNPLFHRTKYLNMLSSMTKTEFLGVWDSDVIVSTEQFNTALTMLTEGVADMVYPYDGRCYQVSGSALEEFLDSRDTKVLEPDRARLLYGHHTCGGAFLVNRKAYTEAGGENEQFTCWGPEDLERYKRWEVLGYTVLRTEGPIYHLWHPTGHNSRYFNNDIRRESLRVLLATCRQNHQT